MPNKVEIANGDTGASYSASAPLAVAANDFPVGATPITGTSGNVANASAVATLTASAGLTNYITGFDVSGSGATAGSIVVVTVAGLLGGSLTFTHAAVTGATVLNSPLRIVFPKPIPANTTNTAITVTCPALGAGNTNNVANAFGYRL